MQSLPRIVHTHLNSYNATDEIKREVKSIVSPRSAQVSGFYIRIIDHQVVAIGKRKRRINDLVDAANEISEFARMHKRKIPTAFNFVTVEG